MDTTALPRRHEHPAQPGTPPSRRGARAWMIVTQLFFVLSLVPWLLVAGLSMMAFDAGVPRDPAMWAMLGFVYGYPFYSLALAVGAWMAYRRGGTRMAMVLTSVLVVPAIAVVAFLVWAASPPS